MLLLPNGLIYSDLSIVDEREARDTFADACFALGFEMDCGQALEEAYPDKNALYDYPAMEKIVNDIDDISLLGSAIFSKWRYITHWGQSDLFSAENRPWFIAIFRRLEHLSSL
jgi:hypothetical protein